MVDEFPFDSPEGRAPAWYRQVMDVCPPRFAPVPNWRRRHRLTLLSRIAEAVGFTLLPWQSLVLRLATEATGDGLPVYRNFFWVVPRQAGKTLVAQVLCLGRMITHPGQLVLYSAQTGADAKKKIERDWWPSVRDTALAEVMGLKIRRGANFDIKSREGSALEVLSSSRDAGRGLTRVGYFLKDEAMTERDDVTEGVVLPTMATIDDAQFLGCSTAGDDGSVWLRGKREVGRADPSKGWVEWSVSEDSDFSDPAVHRAAHPGLAFGLIRPEAVMDAYHRLGSVAFGREYLGVWDDEGTTAGIGRRAWDRVQNPERRHLTGRLALAIDGSEEHQRLVCVVSDGRVVEVAKWREGTAGASDWVLRRLAKHPDIGVVAAHVLGPVGYVLDDLEQRAGEIGRTVEVRRYGSTLYSQACHRFLEAVLEREMGINRSTGLDQAVISADRRTNTVGGWRWWPRFDDAFLSPLVAATLAFDAGVRLAQEPPPSPPQVWVASDFDEDDEFTALSDSFTVG